MSDKLNEKGWVKLGVMATRVRNQMGRADQVDSLIIPSSDTTPHQGIGRQGSSPSACQVAGGRNVTKGERWAVRNRWVALRRGQLASVRAAEGTLSPHITLVAAHDTH